MKLVVLIFAMLSCYVSNLIAQPSLPIMTRQVIWIQPITNNVTSYVLTWGTNRVVINNATSRTEVIKLNPGINEVVLRAANGPNVLSDGVTNLVRMLQNTLEASTNGGTTWYVRTNFSYVVEFTKTNEIFRTKLDWVRP
mgnify:CR=1 FL=1